MDLFQFDTQVSGGPCLSCMGFYQNPCYCRSAQTDGLSVSTKFISNQVEILMCDTIQPHEDQKNQPPASSPQESAQEDTQNEKKGRRRDTKDNIAHKRISKVLKDCYKTITKQKVPEEINRNYYKVSFFLLILSRMEKQGDLRMSGVEKDFSQRMERFCEKIKEEHADEPEYLQHLQVLVKRHLKALKLFLDLQLEASMKTLFDFENMRQRQHFYSAMRELNQLRLGLGLPIQSTL